MLDISQKLQKMIDKYKHSVDEIYLLANYTHTLEFSGSKINSIEVLRELCNVKVILRKDNKENTFIVPLEFLENSIDDNISKIDKPMEYVLNNMNVSSKSYVDESLKNPKEIFEQLLNSFDNEIIETIIVSNILQIDYVVNSFGLNIEYTEKHTTVSATITQDINGEKQSQDLAKSGKYYEYSSFVEEIKQSLYGKFQPKQLPSGKYNCLFVPQISKFFINTFLDLIYGKNIIKKISNVKIGDLLWNPVINIKENIYPDMKYDYQGIELSNKFIVQDGILKNLLINRKHAKKLEIQPSGNDFDGETYVKLEVSTSNYQIKQDYIIIHEIMSENINITNGDASIAILGMHNNKPFSNSILVFNLFDFMKRIIPLNDLDQDFSISAPSFFIEGLFVTGN